MKKFFSTLLPLLLAAVALRSIAENAPQTQEIAPINTVEIPQSNWPQIVHSVQVPGINDVKAPAAEPRDFDPLIAIILMVKDEEPVIVQTLQPYLDAGIRSFFVYDTGSTDRTVEVVSQWFEANDLTYQEMGVDMAVKRSFEPDCDCYIVNEPFINFCASRNKALDYADSFFPKAGYFLFPDAEWYMHGTEQLVEFCRNESTKTYPEQWQPHSYLVRIVNPAIDFYTQRLICRGAEQARFVGVVHETIGQGTPFRIPRDIYFELGTSRYGIGKSSQRWERDEKLLRAEYEKNHEDSRTAFYLAQTLECLGRLEEAHDMYLHRTTLKGWYEEDFMTWYRLAQITERLDQQHENHPEYNWDRALCYYLTAYQTRPQRVEPLIKVMLHYRQEDQHHLAYLFGLRAAQTPYPVNDVLFVDKYLYDFTRWDTLAQSAFYANELGVGKQALQEALRAQPHLPHLHRNMSLYLEKEQMQQQMLAQQRAMIEAAQHAQTEGSATTLPYNQVQ